MNSFGKFILGLLFFLSINSFSQDERIDLYDLDIKELSKFKVISATKTSEDINKVPATVRVVTQSEISERGYFTLDELLTDLPGFQFRDILSLNSYVFQRGIPNQNNLTLVLIDGIQVNELNSGGFYGGGQFNMSDIDRVEVVYGPSSVAYGTNAMSGVINIITKENANSIGTLKSQLGNFNTVSGDCSFNLSDKSKKLKVRVTGMFKMTEKSDLRGAEGDYNWSDLIDNYENDYNFGIKISYNDFEFGTNYLQKQTSTATMYKSIGSHYQDFGSFWNILFVNNYLKYTKKFSDNLTLNSTLYNRNSTVLKNSIYYITDTSQVGYYRPNNLTGFETVINYNGVKNLSLTGGMTFEFESLADKPSMTFSESMLERPELPIKPEMHENYLASFFFEPRYVLFEKLYLSAGIRYDLSSIYNQVITPRAGISYNMNGNYLRVTYADAFRAPKPWDYTNGLGNDNLMPEKMNSLELSFTSQTISNLSFEITGYANNLHNSIYKEILSEGYRWINRGEIFTLGLETSLKYTTGKLNASINYTYTDSKDENRKNIPEISKHSGNVYFSYYFSDKLNLNLRGNFLGERENNYIIPSTNSKTIDPYFLLNGAVNWSPIKDLSLQLIVKNILDTEYYHTSNRAPERYRQPQRMIIISVGYKIS